MTVSYFLYICGKLETFSLKWLVSLLCLETHRETFGKPRETFREPLSGHEKMSFLVSVYRKETGNFCCKANKLNGLLGNFNGNFLGIRETSRGTIPRLET